MSTFLPYVLRLFIILVSLLTWKVSVFALYNPLTVPNNRYGIHVADPNDIAETKALLNSSNGDWGYVTVVIQDNDLKKEKWGEFFNTMRRNHLIPIVRIATHVEGAHWVIPQEHDIDKWVDFLTSLNWPIENRYVVLFNEPNHAKEWGDTIDPEGYGKMLIKFSKALKEASEDFFVLPAGFDASAQTDGAAMDEATYLQTLLATNPDVLSFIDGWTSHAYANPEFSGSPYAMGRGTLSTFLWEQNFLQRLGNTKSLPIFITETGWQHAYGKYYDGRLLSPETVGENLRIASQSLWQDASIVAITPFIYNYQDYPFDHFSWKKLNSSEFYAHYYAYQNIPKIPGKPKQRERYISEKSLFPDTLVVNSSYTLETEIQNVGQNILSAKDGYILTIRDQNNVFDVFTETVPTLEPQEKGIVRALIKTPSKAGLYELNALISHETSRTAFDHKTIEVIPPPSAQLSFRLGWRRKSNNQTATVLIYDMNDALLHKFTNVQTQNNSISITGLYAVVPGKQYRIVLLVPYYLPRQAIITMQKTANVWQIKRLLPLDFSRDGKLTWDDLKALLGMQPFTVWQLIIHL